MIQRPCLIHRDVHRTAAICQKKGAPMTSIKTSTLQWTSKDTFWKIFNIYIIYIPLEYTLRPHGDLFWISLKRESLEAPDNQICTPHSPIGLLHIPYSQDLYSRYVLLAYRVLATVWMYIVVIYYAFPEDCSVFCRIYTKSIKIKWAEYPTSYRHGWTKTLNVLVQAHMVGQNPLSWKQGKHHYPLIVDQGEKQNQSMNATDQWRITIKLPIHPTNRNSTNLSVNTRVRIEFDHYKIRRTGGISNYVHQEMQMDNSGRPLGPHITPQGDG